MLFISKESTAQSEIVCFLILAHIDMSILELNTMSECLSTLHKSQFVLHHR
jgi:hypothetical protein